MTRKTPDPTRSKAAPDRADRLKAALKENLARRKAQAKARDRAEQDKTGKDKG